jgi:DinB superfamily
MNRIELEHKLNEGREWLLTTYEELSDEELRRPRTASEHDPQNQWSALDHFVHLALIERNFNKMIRRHFSGHANPVGLLNDDQGRPRTREQIMASVHELTEEWQREHHSDSFSEAVAITASARAETLQLMSELTDTQLEETLPGAPWADGTVSGVLGTNADHGRMHWHWVEKAADQAS